MMAVLEAVQGVGGPTSIFDAHAKIVIAGLDAIGRARAPFQPRTQTGGWYIAADGKPTREEPYVYAAPGQAVVFSPHEAYAVRGTVYFIDGYGTVFRMGVDGTQTVVTKFPIGLDQQEVSFAVSPDGCQLAATVLTLPPAPQLVSGQSPPPLSGTWTLRTMRAEAGSTAEVLHRWTGSDYPNSKGTAAFENLVMVGWDSMGPIAAIHSSIGVPGGTHPVPIANVDFYGASLVHMSPDGMPGPALALGGASGCNPVQVTPVGDVTCYAPNGAGMVLTVVSTLGANEFGPVDHTDIPEGVYNYSIPTVAVGPAGLIAISGQTQAANQSQTGGEWRGPNGGGSLPANFLPEGWVDPLTIFGLFGEGDSGGHNGDAALLRIGPTQSAEDLGFKGDFVGMLS